MCKFITDPVEVTDSIADSKLFLFCCQIWGEARSEAVRDDVSISLQHHVSFLYSTYAMGRDVLTSSFLTETLQRSSLNCKRPVF